MIDLYLKKAFSTVPWCEITDSAGQPVTMVTKNPENLNDGRAVRDQKKKASN